jgi:hypothetical protein
MPETETTFEIPDNWKLDSGLRETVPKFTIASSYFAQTANYQTGIPYRLYLIGFDTETEPFTVKMSVGSDWVSSDGGRTIAHPTKKRINNSSTYGHWIYESMSLPGLREELVARTQAQFNGLGPLAAGIWDNMILRLATKSYQFGRVTADNPPRNFLMPAEFLGLDTGQGDGNSVQSLVVAPPTQPVVAEPAVSTQASPTPAERVAAARAARNGPVTSNPLMTQLYDLAKSCPTHDEFMQKAWEIDEVLADDKVAELVADPSAIYSQART